MQEIKNEPSFRFPEFSGEWEVKNFRDVFSFFSTNSLSRSQLNSDSGIVRNIHYGDIHTKFKSLFHLDGESVPYINQDVDLSRIKEENYCQEGDLVIADASEDYNDIGKAIEIASLSNQRVIAGLHTFLARPNRFPMALGFSGQMMKSWALRKQIMRIAQGSKVLSLATGRLGEAQLVIPTLPEQQKIAAFLAAVDARIEQLTQKKSHLDQYKKGVMQKIFSQEIRFKDENGNDYPDWEEKKLGEVCKYYDGTHQTPKYVEKGVPFYSVEHVTANQFINTKFISEEVFENENKRVKLEKGDILMTRIGSIGVAKYIDWDVKASFYVSLALIKANKKTNSLYLSHFIHSTFFQKELWKRTIHVAFPQKINLGEIGDCTVYLPDLEEQTQIANFLSAIDDKIALVSKQLEHTQQFKKGLLQQMLV